MEETTKGKRNGEGAQRVRERQRPATGRDTCADEKALTFTW